MMSKMSFNEFINIVTRDIKQYLPGKYKSAVITVCNVVKNNDHELTGISINIDNDSVVPAIYLEEFYDKYCNGTEIPTILREIANTRERGNVTDNNFEWVSDFEKCKNKIFPKLVNAKWNSVLLLQKAACDH